MRKIKFIYLFFHNTYTFTGWETTTAIANYSGPTLLQSHLSAHITMLLRSFARCTAVMKGYS
jgi:hypothetical protein